MSLSQVGTVNLQNQIEWFSTSLRFGPDGFQTVKRGKGSRALCLSEAETLQAQGWEGSVDPIDGEPFSVITATLAALNPSSPDAGLVPRWSLDVQWSEVEPQRSQAFLAYIAANGGYGGETFRAIVAAADAAESSGNWSLYDALSGSAQLWAFDIMNKLGVKEPDAVLTRHNSYPTNTTNTVDWVDVNKVFTTAQIVALSQPPSAIIGTLPTNKYWLKTSAGAGYGSDGRFEVATHWVSGSVETYPSHKYTYKT